jgi:hypothetical protein
MAIKPDNIAGKTRWQKANLPNIGLEHWKRMIVDWGACILELNLGFDAIS